MKEGVLWNTDTTFFEHHKDVSPAEWWAMVQMMKCSDKTLQKAGRVWFHHADPEGKGTWNLITTFTALNCEAEEITLEQNCDTSPIVSVVGEVSRNQKLGFAVTSQRTFVWSDIGGAKRPCELTSFPRRQGRLFNDSGVMRLRDQEQQMDFVLGDLRKSCHGDSTAFYSVRGQPRMLLFFGGPPERIARAINVAGKGFERPAQLMVSHRMSPRAVQLSPSNSTVFSIPTLKLEEYFPEHMQNVRNILLEQENQIGDALGKLNCLFSKIKVDSLYALSKASGILAAKAVQLNQCESLQSFGRTGIVRQCRSLRLNFGVDNTSKCGSQPRSGNWSIAQDGFMVLPYSACLWRGAVVNFGGEPYQLSNGEWQRVKPNFNVEHKVLAAHFNHEIDASGALLTAAMEREHSLTFNLLAQLAGTMEQHGMDNVGPLVQTVEQVAQIPELFSRIRLFKIVLGAAVGVAATVLVSLGVWKARGCLKKVWERTYGNARRRRVGVITQTLPNLPGSSAEHHSVAPAPASAPVTLYPERALYQVAKDYCVVGSTSGGTSS